MDLRASVNWGIESEEMWLSCLEQSLCVVASRDVDEALIGIGFLAGNDRHAQLVDICVHPSAQRQGLGKQLVIELLAFARERQIRYVTLTWDEGKPWLEDLYASVGFTPINSSMSFEGELSRSDRYQVEDA